MAFSLSLTLKLESADVTNDWPSSDERRILSDLLTRVKGIEVTLEHHHDMLHSLNEQGIEIMATQQELAASLGQVNDKLVKVGAETQSLLKAIDDLKAQLANAPVSPELQAAFDKVAAQAQVVDDLVPDAAPPAPAP